MKKYLIITADSNDGDYLTSKHEITDEELELIKPVVEAIKNFKPYKVITRNNTKWNHCHNYPNNECCREDLGEKTTSELYGHLKGYNLFNDLIPYNEFGIHTIESVEFLVVQDEIKLL